MIQVSQIHLTPEQNEEFLKKKIAKILCVKVNEIVDYKIVKKSIDARKKPDIFFTYTVQCNLSCDENKVLDRNIRGVSIVHNQSYVFPKLGNQKMRHNPIVIGMGPAGLFCAYFLAKYGYKPIVLERGNDVDQRLNDVEEFWKSGQLNEESNVQFGEGGAGTFSDGKLNTLVNDKCGRNLEVLKIFVECGAPENILYDGKPHIGTEVLRTVVKNMRLKIIEWGGQVYFQHKVIGFQKEGQKLNQIMVEHKDQISFWPCEIAIWAIGHSARDTFQILYEHQVPMEAKPFSVGFRVQHEQSTINEAQYGEKQSDFLPPATYKLAAKTSSGRNIYSFCMCPGGYVVDASSEKRRLVVNGMSYSSREGVHANSAIVMSVSCEDFHSNHPLAGVYYQRKLEERAYLAGGGKIPCAYYGDFKSLVTGNIAKGNLNKKPQICGRYCFADLTNILSDELNHTFIEGMELFHKVIPEFNLDDTILSGVESRTSSPVRILRDDSFQSLDIYGMYPCGEGAGYAGGIVSAAMDGMKVAEKIGSIFKNLT